MASPDPTGTYTYRFEGRARAPHIGTTLDPSRPYFLVGQGWMTLNADKTIFGQQASSIMPTQGDKAGFRNASTELRGTFEFNDDLTGAAKITGTADIHFYKIDKTGKPYTKPSLRGYFHLLGRPGSNSLDAFWFISTETLHLKHDAAKGTTTEITVDELVRGEAARM